VCVWRVQSYQDLSVWQLEQNNTVIRFIDAP
jgi:hypothetical protein